MSSNNKFGTIIQIGDVLVSEDVVTEHFACDYAVCKGCCCIIGDSGARWRSRSWSLWKRVILYIQNS